MPPWRGTASSMKKPSADERAIPAREGRGEVRERASRFLAFAFPVSDPDEAAQAVGRLKRQYHDATHVAFAWRIGSGDTAARRSSDAGEPSGTAGRPIAAAIESAGICDVLVAVVRYFGGTKLGTGGLSRAYRAAAGRALEAAGRRTIRETSLVVVTCPYEKLGSAQEARAPPAGYSRGRELRGKPGRAPRSGPLLPARAPCRPRGSPPRLRSPGRG